MTIGLLLRLGCAPKGIMFINYITYKLNLKSQKKKKGENWHFAEKYIYNINQLQSPVSNMTITGKDVQRCTGSLTSNNRAAFLSNIFPCFCLLLALWQVLSPRLFHRWTWTKPDWNSLFAFWNCHRSLTLRQWDRRKSAGRWQKAGVNRIRTRCVVGIRYLTEEREKLNSIAFNVAGVCLTKAKHCKCTTTFNKKKPPSSHPVEKKPSWTCHFGKNLFALRGFPSSISARISPAEQLFGSKTPS